MNYLILKDGGRTKFEKDEDGVFKLKPQKEVKIFFFKNGLVIEGFKFYNYARNEAKRVLHDILDGYMPYILKCRYPDGVLLQPVNNLHKEYTIEEGQQNVINLNAPKVKKEHMTGEEFLKLFPENSNF